jgi:hypothetical protein
MINIEYTSRDQKCEILEFLELKTLKLLKLKLRIWEIVLDKYKTVAIADVKFGLKLELSKFSNNRIGCIKYKDKQIAIFSSKEEMNGMRAKMFVLIKWKWYFLRG